MTKAASLLVSIVFGGLPLLALALTDGSPAPVQNQVLKSVDAATVPAACETCGGGSPIRCAAGGVAASAQGDIACATSRIGVPTYTSQLSEFHDEVQCSWGPCNQATPGIAHRTWPQGSRVEVCNLKNNICSIAVVMDRGPNSSLPRTIDANAALMKAIHMDDGLVPAVYTLLSAPGVAKTAEPKNAPSDVTLETLQAEKSIVGNLGNNNGNPSQYTQVNTPYGPGYLGNPTSKPYYGMQSGGSPYASASPAPISSGASGGYTSAPMPVSQQLGTSPYSAVTGSNAGTALQNAISPAAAQPPTQQIIAGAPQVGRIIVQPQTVSATGSLVLAWTSLNMKAGSCAVSLGNQVLASGPEGSKTISAANLGGTVQFSLKCTRQDGTAFQATDTVMVQ